ncbi:hypothetical protein PHYSODRAFT_253675 [Phytophthora sojae]|uniref:Uncharacterized protein n=1 Tax=Phytophthora sojae (strain P6497) TaxID=1094619 RepID=G5AA89_PHYSP|nr:hypothetical protein PHYSODRAFT_253675 [Phytophthora sojae]EGZ07518.1 hypothetical protein PHYSODRAFT_253675 [Phytophthora sojae]|eukprot:XP_009537084.1 hypothetical protein PHYSODRAFT_253675 [Phytophthora sojae]
MEPEEHKDLETVVRDARKAKKAARESEAVQGGDVEASAVQDQPAAGSQTQEEEVSHEFQGSTEHTREGGAQASEGGANAVEPPAADRVSDSPQPEQEEETAKDVPVNVKTEVIEIEESDAEESSALEDADVSSRSPQSSSNQAPSSSQSQAPEPEVLPRDDALNPVPAPQSLNADVRPSLGAGAETADTTQLDETAAKNFVARQVYRWEQMRSGRVVPPSVEYAWPNPRPDFSAWQEATMATSDYLRRRMALENRDAAWIAELRPERRVLGIAQDLTAVAIPPSMMSSRECAAVLETLLFEAGFEFVNAVPDWFMTHASKINPGYMRSVVEEVQQLLTIELIEWKQLTAGVSFKVVPASDTKPAFKEEKTQDAQAVNAREGHRNPKRPQYRPARPLSVSTPSVHSLVPSTDVSLNADARAMSVQGSTLNASSSGISDSVPSLIGPSGTSNDSTYATSFHTQTSRDSSSSSSLMSLGHSASTHMRPGLVMSVQAGGALAAAPDMGMFVTKPVIPARRTLPDQDDVDMAEVASAETRSSRTASRRRSSKAKPAVKQEKLELAPSESGLTSEGLQHSSRRSRHDRSVRTRSSRTSRSLRSGSRSSSASSGAAQVALNVMRQLQEQQAAFQTQLSQAQLDMQLEMQPYSGPVEPADYAAVHEDHLLRARSDVAEVATKLAKQQYEADREDLERRWKGRLNAAEAKLQRAEAESASAEAERARRAEEVDGEMKKRLDSVQQTIRNVPFERKREPTERELERDTALNRQKFLADQIRELRATLSQVQAVRAATAPHPATGIKTETSAVPQSTTLNQVSSGAINDGVAPGTGCVHSKNTTEVGAAQLRATVGTSLPKKEAAASSQGMETVTTSKSSASKSGSAAKGSASSAAKKSAAKKSASRRSSSRKGSKEDADPPSSDPDDSDSSSSDSSGDDSSSCDYSSRSSDDFDLDLRRPRKTRPFGRIHRTSTTMRLRSSASMRPWKIALAQLDEAVSLFMVMYCRTTGSYSERYYTMKVRSGKTPRKFFYRRNAAAVKAGIEF